MTLITVQNQPGLRSGPFEIHRRALVKDVRLAVAVTEVEAGLRKTDTGCNGIIVTLGGENELADLQEAQNDRSPVVIIVETCAVELETSMLAKALLAACKRIYPNWPAVVHFRSHQTFRATMSAK